MEAHLKAFLLKGEEDVFTCICTWQMGSRKHSPYGKPLIPVRAQQMGSCEGTPLDEKLVPGEAHL
jgi:hypothetical protein